jgi:Protein tyrosine and serine/threonine kinase/Protein kinase domain
MNLFAPFHRTSLRTSDDTGFGNKAVKDSSFEVIAIIERIRRSSPLLQEPSQQVTSHFKRDEILVGAILRLGEFSATFAVTQLPHYAPPGAVPRTWAGSSGDSTTIRSAASVSHSPEEDERRRVCTSNVQLFQLKQLNPKLIKKQSKHRNANSRLYDVAAATLVLEAQYLARVSHPNIVALHGLPLGEGHMQHIHGGFFILTDRIVETLAERLAKWKEVEENTGTVALKLDTGSKAFQEKTTIAKEVLGALDYLHSHHRIVVLNLNPSNIGFSQEGTVLLFDLGHCRQVSLAVKQAGTNNKATESISDHHLSDDEISGDDLSVMLGSPVVADAASQSATTIAVSQMGSHRKVLPLANIGIVPRYLAPELVTKGTYNLQSDSYSFSLILFEMMTLSKPFSALKPGQHLIQVCMEGKRPNLTLYRFPPALENLLKQGWKHNHRKRLKISIMKQVVSSMSFSSSSSRRGSSSKQQRRRQQVKARSPAPPRESEGKSKQRRRRKPTKSPPEPQAFPPLSPDHRQRPSESGGALLRRKSDGNLLSMISPTARKNSVQMNTAMRQRASSPPDHPQKPTESGGAVLRRKSDGNLLSMISPTARKNSVQMNTAMRHRASLPPDHPQKPTEGGGAALRHKSDGNLLSMISPIARRNSVQMNMALRQKTSNSHFLME